MKLKKVVSLLTAAMLSTTLLAGCSSTEDADSGGKTTLRFATWDNEENLKLQEDLVKKFNEQHDDIDVVLEAYGSEFDTKLSAGIGAGDTPDLMYMWNYPLYSGALEPLDSYIEKEGKDYKNSFFETLWNYNSYEENTYGIPVGYTTHVVYYNKDIFDAAGVEYPSSDWTWKEFEETAKKLTNKEKKTYGFGFSSKPDPYDFEMMLWNNGASYLGDNEELKGNVNSKESIEVYQAYQNMAKDGIALPTEGSGTTEMKSGSVAMYIYGSWSLSDFQEQGMNFGTTVIPTFKEGNKAPSVVSSSGVSMSRDCKNKEAAWEFIKYWTSEEANKARIEYELPVIKSVAESEKLLENKVYSPFYTMLEQSKEYTPSSFKVKNWTEISEELSTVQEGIFNPTTLRDPKESVDSIAK